MELNTILNDIFTTPEPPDKLNTDFKTDENFHLPDEPDNNPKQTNDNNNDNNNNMEEENLCTIEETEMVLENTECPEEFILTASCKRKCNQITPDTDTPTHQTASTVCRPQPQRSKWRPKPVPSACLPETVPSACLPETVPSACIPETCYSQAPNCTLPMETHSNKTCKYTTFDIGTQPQPNSCKPRPTNSNTTNNTSDPPLFSIEHQVNQMELELDEIKKQTDDLANNQTTDYNSDVSDPLPPPPDFTGVEYELNPNTKSQVCVLPPKPNNKPCKCAEFEDTMSTEDDEDSDESTETYIYPKKNKKKKKNKNNTKRKIRNLQKHTPQCITDCKALQSHLKSIGCSGIVKCKNVIK